MRNAQSSYFVWDFLLDNDWVWSSDFDWVRFLNFHFVWSVDGNLDLDCRKREK